MIYYLSLHCVSCTPLPAPLFFSYLCCAGGPEGCFVCCNFEWIFNFVRIPWKRNPNYCVCQNCQVVSISPSVSKAPSAMFFRRQQWQCNANHQTVHHEQYSNRTAINQSITGIDWCRSHIHRRNLVDTSGSLVVVFVDDWS